MGLSIDSVVSIRTLQLTSTPELIQDFRVATAMAITRYCRSISCAVISASGQEKLALEYSLCPMKLILSMQ